MKTTKTGWDFISELRMAGAKYYDCRSYIEVNYRYSCGCCYYQTTLTLQEFKDKYADSTIEYSHFFEDYDRDRVEEAYVEIAKSYLCHECDTTKNRIYCDECKRPGGFEYVTKYHGIAAYNAADLDKVSDYVERVYSIMQHPEWQICCSSIPIGEIGIVVDAEVLCASSMDLYTEIDPNTGRRFFDGSRYRARFLVDHACELDPSVWSHDEIVTQHNKVSYVWVSSSADDMIKRYGQYIAYLFKMEYVEVDNALQL